MVKIFHAHRIARARCLLMNAQHRHPIRSGRSLVVMTQQQVAIHRSRFVRYTPGNITALAFSHRSTEKLTPSDLRLAVGRADGSIEVWNPRDNWFQEMVVQGGRDRTIEGLCWSNTPGGPLRLFSIGGSTIVTEWDLASGLPLRNYDCNAGVIWSLCVNSANTKLAVGCDNGTVVLIDISGGRGVMEHDSILTRQDARVLALTWAGDDSVVGGCSDGRIRIWCVKEGDQNRGRLLHTMKVDKSKKESTLVWSVQYLPRTNQIVSGDSTGAVKFWDFHYATLMQTFKVHQADVLCLATDITNTKVFSAGVDRKIHQFLHSGTGSASKWTPSSNRLFHANDVRCMASYQSKGCDFLISGGVEKALVISSLSSFADGSYRKMPVIAPFHKNVLVNQAQRLIVGWQDSTVRIWRIGEELNTEKNYQLVAKLVLKEEQNISACAMSPNGEVLAVGWPSTTKVFHIQPTDTKFRITKLDNDFLLKTGCRLVQFVDDSKLVMCSNEDDLFYLDLEADDDENAQLIELPDIQQTKSSLKLPYINTVNHIFTNNDNQLVVSRVCGAVDIIDLATSTARPLVRLMNFVTAINFTGRNTIMLVTSENNIYEFNLASDEGVLTTWCKNNAENLPLQFTHQKDKCLGIFSDLENTNKVWLWGLSWLASLNLAVDLPVNKRRKLKKRSRDGLTIEDESSFINGYAGDGDEDEEDEIDIADDFFVKNQVSKSASNASMNSKDKSAFFITDKYRPIFYAEKLSKTELVIIERPAFTVPQPPAFEQPKLRF
ncbi:AaceriAGR367Cp [[Ashbya] aceris (nom. inval.)]|nr:AaceriAGR367Cp [[Ashbya] aceris (nom. inval.)]